MPSSQLPLLPLILDRVPAGLAEALTQEGVPYRAWSLGAPQGRFLLFDSRKGPNRSGSDGQIPIDLDSFRPMLGEDPFLALVDEQTAAYTWQFGEVKIVHARGRSDRRAARHKLFELLRNRIEAVGGIWLCLAAYPFPFRSAVNIRLDHPAYEPSTFDAVLKALAGHESAVSHFVQIAKFYPFPEALSQLRGFDLGIQCDDDQSFHRVVQIEQNLRHNLDLMRRVGLEPEGFLPAGGRYLPALPPLLQQIEFPYVVLDDLGADDVPFFPASGSVLHVPAHPIGVRALLAAVEGSRFRSQDSGDEQDSRSETGVSERERRFRSQDSGEEQDSRSETGVSERDRSSLALLSAYFLEALQRKYHAGEPLFFHGQTPGGWGRHPELIRQLFDLAQDFSAAWKTTLSQFSRWWKSRAEVRLTVVEQDGLYMLSADYLPRNFRLGVEYHRGRHVARMAVAHRVLRFSPSALAYENHPREPAFLPVRIDGPHGNLRPNRQALSVEKARGKHQADNFILRTLRVLRGRKKSFAP
jgi:hypothetical protein